MACDPYWNQVVLALHMDGTNGSTTFTDVTGKTVTPSGDAKISTAQSKFGGASAYFDGAGDYLSTSASSDFSHGTRDFTIEFWCRPTTATNAVLLDGRAIGPDGPQVALWLNAASRLELYVSGAARIAGTSAVATASWHHIALSRASGTTRLFLDGVSLGTWADSTSYSETRYVLGADRAGSLSPFTGYIDDLRITKGIARYTANFTPPTEAFTSTQCAISGVVGSPGNYLERIVRAYRRDTGALIGQAASNPTTGAYSISAQHDGECFAIVHDSTGFDPHWSSVVLALHMNGTNGSAYFKDEVGKTVTASGNAQISTTQSKFGGASAYFDGTGGYLTVASSADFAIISGNFTVEFFAYFASSAGNQAFVEFYADANNRWNIGLVGNIQFYTLVGGSGSAKITATAPSNNAWNHVALVKSGSTFTLYVDGSSVGTSTTTSYHTTNSSVSIGWAGGGGGSPYTGYIDDLRITKGVARYTANFTAPTAAFLGGIEGGTNNAIIYDRIIPL